MGGFLIMNSKEFSAMICTYVLGMAVVAINICLFAMAVELFCN